MHYSSEPRDGIYVKSYGFLSFAKKVGTHATKVAKNLSNMYSQKLLNCFKKKAIKKTAEASGDLIGNKIADKIASVSKKSSQNNLDKANNEITKKIYISPEERQQVIDELRLV